MDQYKCTPLLPYNPIPYHIYEHRYLWSSSILPSPLIYHEQAWSLNSNSNIRNESFSFFSSLIIKQQLERKKRREVETISGARDPSAMMLTLRPRLLIETMIQLKTQYKRKRWIILLKFTFPCFIFIFRAYISGLMIISQNMCICFVKYVHHHSQQKVSTLSSQ